MTDKKRVACFFTGGYTELNAMKSFMIRINGNAEYKQLCPVGPRKSRDAIRNRTSIDSSQSGLTVDSLVRFVLETVDKPHFIRESYDVILIEDDKDDRFLNKDTSTIDMEKWESFKEDIRQRLADKGVTVPVIVFLAAPEIEAWFVSDWENGFGQVYKNSGELNGPQNTYFSTVFRKHVTDKILTDKYSGFVEAYGYFDGDYKKLSEEIQSALNTTDFMVGYEPAFEHEPIRYSKRKQGETMLENIDPNKVLDGCAVFFKEAFFKLRNI